MPFERATLKERDGIDTYRAAVEALEQTGCPRLEAELRMGRQLSLRAVFTGTLPAPLAHAAEREGLMVVQHAGETSVVGSVLSFRALLTRWPAGLCEDEGKALAQQLGVRWQTYQPLVWRGNEPPAWQQKPLLMGILNVTPDSFSDGGRYFAVERAVERALAMVAEGADMLDIGGESTRPGAEAVSAEEEAARVIPVIRALARQVQVPISIDTYKPQVAAAALDAGAAVINDITGLSDPDMIQLAARTGAPVIVMHMQGTPRTMQQDPSYDHVVAEVTAWLAEACRRAEEMGVNRSQLIIDPGIGFGKKTEHNLELLRRLADLRILGHPVLLGCSRKSVIGYVLGLPVDQRLEGTAATTALAVAERVDIIRVHDVQAMRRVIDMSCALTARSWSS